MIHKTLFLISAIAAGITFAAPPALAQTDVEVFSAEFGVFNASNPEALVFEPSLVVPHRQGQRYGWIIEVRSGKRSLSVREEYLLPVAAKTPQEKNPISENLGLDVPPQRRNQVSQRQLVPVDGKIYGEWAIGPNEPAGHRHLQVVIENQTAASFEFDVK